MRFAIRSIEETIFEEDVTSITLPTESGEITVLDDHEPLITLVKPGAVRVQGVNGGPETIDFPFAGFLEVRPEGEGIVLLAA